MNGKAARKSSLFLLELMISILMFSITSAWCVRLFVTARSVVNGTEEMNRAQNLAAGYAELFLALEDFEAYLLNEGGRREENGEGTAFRLCYDKDWNICAEEKAVFVFNAVITEEEDFEKCFLSFNKVDGEDVIYLLDVEKYTGSEAAL